MNLLNDDSTIVAIASGLKNSAIGVIRISGEKSIEYLSKVFYPKQKNITRFESYKAYFGLIKENEETIDEVIALIYRKPKSYTGEDMVEIFCHGNLILMQKIVDLFIKQGCRLAKPGEFTLRAVLNKKMDLTKAQAIKDLIEAQTEQVLKLSLKNLQGYLSDKINNIKQKIMYWLTWIEATLDFPEEDIPPLELENLKTELNNLSQQINNLLSNYQASKIYKEGIDTLIIGKPNVGKSTLFNYLYGQERVITSDVPGTTRDIITEYINIDGIILKIYDTAGLRKTKDTIEKIGIEKALTLIQKSQLILWVIEYNNWDQNDIEIINEISHNLSQNPKIIAIINKIDKATKKQEIDNFVDLINTTLKGKLDDNNIKIIPCSLKENINLQELKNKIKEICLPINQDIILINEFQYQILNKINFYLKKALEDFNLSLEIIAVNLKESLNSIAELTGENITDQIIENMLSNFCVGK